MSTNSIEFLRFSQDRKTRLVDKQFMWGPALLISPVLEQGKLSVDVYIPDDVWYDYYTVRENEHKSHTFLNSKITKLL